MPIKKDPKQAARREQCIQATRRLRQKRTDDGNVRLELWVPQETLKWLDNNRGKKTRQEALAALLQAHARQRLPFPTQ